MKRDTGSLTRTLLALAAACGLAASPCARAAVDDINDAQAPSFDDTHPVLAAAQRFVAKVVKSEHAVVEAVKQTFAPPAETAASLRLGTAAGEVARSQDLAVRAAAAAAPPSTPEPSPSTAAVADLSLGANWRVLQGDADTGVPSAAWMADVLPASGASLAHSSALRPSLHLSAEWSLPGDISVGVMPGMAVDLDDMGRRTATGTLALTVGKAWTPQWQTYVDMARDRLALAQTGNTARTVDAGLRFVASSNTQVDVALTHGLSAAAPAFQAGVGVSSKF